MKFYKQSDYRINVEMIVAYKPAAGDNGILVYLQGGHELKWTFNDKQARDNILGELDKISGFGDKGSLNPQKITF